MQVITMVISISVPHPVANQKEDWDLKDQVLQIPCGPSYVCGAINPMNTVRSCWAATINHSQPPPPPFLWDISLGPNVDQARSGRLVFGIVKSTSPHVSSVQAIPLSFHWILVGLEWDFPFLDDFYPQWLLGSELIPELTINPARGLAVPEPPKRNHGLIGNFHIPLGLFRGCSILGGGD